MAPGRRLRPSHPSTRRRAVRVRHRRRPGSRSHRRRHRRWTRYRRRLACPVRAQGAESIVVGRAGLRMGFVDRSRSTTRSCRSTWPTWSSSERCSRHSTRTARPSITRSSCSIFQAAQALSGQGRRDHPARPRRASCRRASRPAQTSISAAGAPTRERCWEGAA